MTGAVDAAIGAQYGLLWINDARDGWSVAVAPGALDLDAAKAAIARELSARLTPEQAAFMTDRLSVWATPYAYADLLPVQNAVFNGVLALDQGWGLRVGIACIPATDGTSDAWRVDATLFTGDVEPSADLVQRAQAVAAPYGDKARVTVTKGDGRVSPAAGTGPVPIPAPLAPAPQPALPLKVAHYVSMPKPSHCVRGTTITVKARTAADLARVAVTAPSRRISLHAGERARVHLLAKRTKLTLTVTTRDGRSSSQTYSFRRCA